MIKDLEFINLILIRNKEMFMEKKLNYNDIIKFARQLACKENFNEYVNERECEELIASKEKEIVLTEELDKKLLKFLDDNIEKNNKESYVIFQLLFTIYRRKRYGNLEGYVNKYIYSFKKYPFTNFLELLMIYNVKKDNIHLNEVIIKSKRLSESKGNEYDFTTHSGVINFYVEAVCTYYELNLDARTSEEGINYLKDAIEKIDSIIRASTKKVYSKFLLNKGRLEILQGKYDIGEEYIIKAIQNIDSGSKRYFTVAEYEQFLTKLEMIKLYDKNNGKIKEVENLKVNNIKSLSLMTALLSFILGTINIFSNVKELKTLALLMIMYFGIIMLLLGIFLLYINLLYNYKNKKFNWFNVILIIIGLLIVSTSVVLILIL